MADNLVSRIYSNFRGVDFRGEEINIMRSPDSLNMWKNYTDTESIRTRPAMAKVGGYDSTIYGIWFYKGDMMVHSGDKLWKGEEILCEGLSETAGNAFVYESVFYFKVGSRYLRYDGTECKDVVGYVPTTTIARKPIGGGQKYEDVNMLSEYRKNAFLSDGASFDYYLDSRNIDDDFVPVVTVNDNVVATSEYTVDYPEGKITFTNYAPDAPLTDGQDNVIIEFKKTVPGYRDNIMGCALLQLFDNRVFVSGNPDYPNVVWHCSLDDPTYWSDLDYYREGLDSAQIRGLVAGNNALWVFREPSDANTTVFYHTPTIDEEYGKIYPSTHSSVSTGCVGKAINFNDDIVFFSERGMEGISGDVTTEQVVAHRSSLVDRKLIAEEGYKDMILDEWNGYLFVFIGKKVYLADSRTAFSNEGHMEYEWFYWEIPHKANCTCVYNNTLYVGTENEIYSFTDYESDVESYWTTPKDYFKHPHKLKTTNKRGCVAEATGDVTVYARLEESDFEFVGEYKEVTDAFVSRIKRKKFKDIQLKFHSLTRFSLETVTLECFIGGYVKRTGAVSYTNPEASKNAEILEDCNEALVSKGVETADTLEQVPQRIGEIQSYADGYDVGVEEGKQAEWSAFWDAFQQNGNRTNYEYAFYGEGWNVNFKPKYDLKPTNAQYMFCRCDIRDLEESLKSSGTVLDTSNCTNVYRMFNNLLNKPDGYDGAIPELDLRKATNLGEMFGYTNCVKILRKLIFNDSGTQDTSTLFHGGMIDLEEIRIEGVIGRNFRPQWSLNLSNESVQSIIDHLKDLTGETERTLTFHKDVGARMTQEQKDAITAKNWTLVLA